MYDILIDLTQYAQELNGGNIVLAHIVSLVMLLSDQALVHNCCLFSEILPPFSSGLHLLLPDCHMCVQLNQGLCNSPETAALVYSLIL